MKTEIFYYNVNYNVKLGYDERNYIVMFYNDYNRAIIILRPEG